MPIAMLREFMKLEASGGIVLVIAAALALVLANTVAAPYYQAVIDAPVVMQVGPLELAKPLLLWINDGLMAIFFLLVGLEIKREVLRGELSSLSKAAMPGIAAIGGMAAPALVYVAVNLTNPEALRGWAIPAATDIAFALGVLALLGSRVPASLKIFLLALAVMDDLGAIVIIALFYTADLSTTSLGLAGAAVLVLIALNVFGVRRVSFYVVVGIFLWVCVLKSGVHATLAGVVIGLSIPLKGGDEDEGHTPLEMMEHALHPWVAFAILPIFAFANAGVSLAGMTLGSLFATVPLGIALGLFLGKQAGVMGAVWLGRRLGIGSLPEGATWLQMYGLSMLTGIGFTMSLFIGTLAFAGQGYDADVRLGVLSGSLLSAVMGFLVLRFAPSPGSRPSSA